MSAQPAESFHLVCEGIGRFRDLFAAQMIVKNTVNAPCNGTHVISERRYAHAAVSDDPTAAGIVGKQIVASVNRCHIKWPEQVFPGAFHGAFNDPVAWYFFQYPVNFLTIVVCTQHQSDTRIMSGTVFIKEIDNFENPAVEGWLPAQQTDSFPLNLARNTLLKEIVNHGDRRFRNAGSLGAGAVAVETLQIALVGYVDLRIIQTRFELPSKDSHNR